MVRPFLLLAACVIQAAGLLLLRRGRLAARAGRREHRPFPAGAAILLAGGSFAMFAYAAWERHLLLFAAQIVLTAFCALALSGTSRKKHNNSPDAP